MEDLMYSGGLVKYWLCEVDSIIQYIFSDFFWEDQLYSIHDIGDFTVIWDILYNFLLLY